MNILIGMIILYVTYSTTKYGVMTWKDQNKLGAISIFFLALCVLVIPIIKVYFIK